VEEKLVETARSVEASGKAERAKGEKGEEPAGTPEEEAQKIADSFDSLSRAGMDVLTHPRFGTLAEKIGSLGEAGQAFLRSELQSETSEKRFLAAAVAEKLKDPALVKDLHGSALADKDFMVRRMASHALAFMDKPEAGDALVDIVKKENRDGGVRVNAWYGLASLKRREAAELLPQVLDEAGGDIPVDFVVDTALKFSESSPELLPSFRKAYDHSQVSKGMKAKLLRALGRDESGQYQDFIRQVAGDAAADADLRKVAGEVLEGR
jgi:HEAT repeat protein